MRGFFEAYQGIEKLALLVREIGRGHNIVIGLLLFHRRLRCLVDIELKAGERKPIGVATYETTKTLPKEIAALLEGIES